jgi:hypothetical protein
MVRKATALKYSAKHSDEIKLLNKNHAKSPLILVHGMVIILFYILQTKEFQGRFFKCRRQEKPNGFRRRNRCSGWCG